MKVKISYMDRNGSYIATNSNDCKDDHDKRVYEAVIEYKCPLSIGIAVGEPIE